MGENRIWWMKKSKMYMHLGYEITTA